MKIDEAVTYVANGFTYFLVLSHANETFQIIELVLALLTSVVLLIYRLWKWWKEAKKDGKITSEELKDGINILKEGIEEINDKKKGDKNGRSSKD